MLSATSQYALRALAHLASLKENETILGRDLAKRTGIPKNYLSKILVTLGGAGIIRASRGTGGGYQLAFRPEQIPLAEAVVLFDKNIVQSACLLGYNHVCSDATACPAHEAWRETKIYIQNFLESTTLNAIADHGDGRPGAAKNPKKATKKRRAGSA
jgi:Rrf2 family iron-sulfur cluster assembly transcriptional regulator